MPYFIAMDWRLKCVALQVLIRTHRLYAANHSRRDLMALNGFFALRAEPQGA